MQWLTDDLLDDEAEDHVVDVAVGPLGARSVHERGATDAVNRLRPIRDIVKVLQVEIARDLGIGVLGIRNESAPVMHEINKSNGVLPSVPVLDTA